jgi:hypothetical protein
MARPRAADNFAVIRARMEKLRRERAGVPEHEARRPDGPRPYAVSARPGLTTRSELTPELRRMLSRGKST